MKVLNINDIQKSELEILVKFRDFCDKHNLTYYLIYGTLLGAIRHKGFIPWDDDIDVGMPREDYDRFIQLTKSKSISEELLVVAGDIDPNFGLTFAKIFNINLFVDKKYKSYIKDGDCLWIDVFPLDGIGCDYNEAVNHLIKAEKLVKKLGRSISIPFKKRVGDNILNFIFRAALRFFYSIRGYKYYKNKIFELRKTYNFDQSSYVACIVFDSYGYREIISKEDMLQKVNVIFEGELFSTIGCWHEYLTRIYGDYMKLPPEEKRSNPHDLVVFRNE